MRKVKKKIEELKDLPLKTKDANNKKKPQV